MWRVVVEIPSARGVDHALGPEERCASRVDGVVVVSDSEMHNAVLCDVGELEFVAGASRVLLMVRNG